MSTALFCATIAFAATVVLPCAHAQSVSTFQYDALGRIVQVIQDGVVVAEYSYDAAGNRIEVVLRQSPSALAQSFDIAPVFVLVLDN